MLVFSSLLRASPLVNCGSLGLPRIALGLDEASQVIEEQVWSLEGFLLKARMGACSSWHPLGVVASVFWEVKVLDAGQDRGHTGHIGAWSLAAKLSWSLHFGVALPPWWLWVRTV